MIRVDGTNVNLPILFKEFEVPRMDFEAWSTKNVPLDAAAAISAAQMVGVQEDQLILKGWNPNNDGTTFTIPGMLNVASAQAITTSLSFATAGNATKAIAAAFAAFEQANALSQAYNLIINPTSWANLLSARFPTSNQREMPEIMELINFGNADGPGRIYVTPVFSAGQGVLAPVDPGRVNMEIYVPREISVDLGYDSRMPNTSNIYGMVWGQNLLT